MATDIETANKALILIGANTITSFGDPQDEAKVMNALYESCRRTVLRLAPFAFATKWAGPLAALASNVGKEFAYEFQIPPDSLRVLRVLDPGLVSSAEVGQADLAKWRVVGGRIGANVSTIHVAYTADVSESLEDSLFTDCLAAYLAHSAAFPLVQDKGIRDAMWSLFTTLQDQAMLAGALESMPDKLRSQGRLAAVRQYGGAGPIGGTV